MDDCGIQLLFENIDVRSGEFSSTDAAFEKEIQFGEGTALGFRNAEVGVDNAAEADTSLYRLLGRGSRGKFEGRGESTHTQKNPV